MWCGVVPRLTPSRVFFVIYFRIRTENGSFRIGFGVSSSVVEW